MLQKFQAIHYKLTNKLQSTYTGHCNTQVKFSESLKDQCVEAHKILYIHQDDGGKVQKTGERETKIFKT